jgi:hypothetical protein
VAASTSLTPAQRSTRSRIAAYARWARSDPRRDPQLAAAIARNPGQVAYWLAKVDPDGELDPGEAERRAVAARNAYMARLALASSKARARRRAESP